MTTPTPALESKRRLLACLVSIEAARWATGARLMETTDDGAQVWRSPSGRLWRVWYTPAGHREASPLEAAQ